MTACRFGGQTLVLPAWGSVRDLLTERPEDLDVPAAVALVVAAVGLRGARPWARPATVALLVVLVISRAVRALCVLLT